MSGQEIPPRNEADPVKLSAFWRYTIVAVAVAVMVSIVMLFIPGTTQGGLAVPLLVWLGILAFVAFRFGRR